MSFRAKVMTSEEQVKFLQSRLQDTISQKRSIQRKYEYLRKQMLPKIIYVESDRRLIEDQNNMIRNLLEENQALYQLNDSLEKRASEAEESASYTEEVSKLYQLELDKVHAEIESLKRENFNLQQKLNRKMEQIDTLRASTSAPLIVEGDEHDLYPDEQKDLLVEILEQAFQNTIKGTRRYDVLSSILEANHKTGIRDELKQRIISWFQGFINWKTTKQAKRTEFSDIGFDLVSEKNHTKFVFKKDDRYAITISCSPTDIAHGTKNTMSDTLRTIF